MKITPDYGQDVPVHCASATVEFGDTVMRISDHGEYIELMAVRGGGSAMPGALVQPHSGNVLRIKAGNMT